MIQQQDLLKRLQTTLPTNLILVGQKYSGKKTLVSEIAPTFDSVEGKVENIRMLTTGDYTFFDVDDWSPVCFSAMLKFLEENTGHCIITCKNIMNLPSSIQSRCVIEYIEPYYNIGHYCDTYGQLEYISDKMIQYADKFMYIDEFDFDVYFSIICNRLRERIKNGENLTKEYLICSKYNASKSLKSLNKKQFISNWQLDIKGLSNEWKRL